MEVIYLSDYNPMKSLKEFHDIFAPNQRDEPLYSKLERRMNLIAEEYEEVMEALGHMDNTDAGYTSSTLEECMVDVAGELADVLYVIYGTAEELGIPLDKVFNAVHGANMNKVWDDGTVHRNEFGKVIKPPNFQKADIRKVIYGELDQA